MVNDDVLIKFAYKRGYKDCWPDFVMKQRERMIQMKLGFPGIGNNDITLLEYGKLAEGDLFIYDPYVEVPQGIKYDEAPVMLKILGGGLGYVEGIGTGDDSIRDPNRTKIKWRDTVQLPPLPPDFLVFRVDSRPTMNGGPAYYYFFKAYHDNRT